MSKKRTNKYLTINGSKDFFKIILDNYKLIIMVTILITGIIYASFSYTNLLSSKSVITNILTNQLKIKATQSFSDCFKNIITSCVIYYCISLVFGLCAIGSPIIACLPFTYGMGIGFEVTYLYSEFGLKGIGYTALMILPMAVVFSIILSYSAKESINMSWDILCQIQDNKKPEIKISTYFKRQLIFAVAYVVAALVNSGIIYSFSSIIKLD